MGRESGAVRFEAVLALLPARTHQPRAAPPPPRRAGDEDDQDDDSDGDGGGGKEDGQSSPLEGEESERRRGRIFLIWADGNLRLLHIGPCAVITEVLCNSRHPNLILPPSTPGSRRFSLLRLRSFIARHVHVVFFLQRLPPLRTSTLSLDNVSLPSLHRAHSTPSFHPSALPPSGSFYDFMLRGLIP